MTSKLNSLKPFLSLNQTASGTENGRVFGAQGYDTLSLHAEGIVAGDIVQVQASNDGTNWLQVGSDITEDGVHAVELGARYYRASVTDNSGGGTVAATFVGG